MPHRTIILWICSLCQNETQTTEKIHHYQLSTLDVRGEVIGPTWTLDICSTCEDNDLGFRSVLDAGMKESKASKRTSLATDGNSAQCPECFDIFTHAGLSLHRAKSHGVVSNHAAKDAVRGTGPLKCPECKFGSTSPQGLAAHRRTIHGHQVEAKVVKGKIPCVEPDCDWSGATMQGLGVHRRHTHGYVSPRARTAAGKSSR